MSSFTQCKSKHNSSIHNLFSQKKVQKFVCFSQKKVHIVDMKDTIGGDVSHVTTANDTDHDATDCDVGTRHLLMQTDK